MGRNLRPGKVETVFAVLKQLDGKEVDKEKLIGELSWRLKCTRRTMLDYMNTAIAHGELNIKWNAKSSAQKKQ